MQKCEGCSPSFDNFGLTLPNTHVTYVLSPQKPEIKSKFKNKQPFQLEIWRIIILEISYKSINLFWTCAVFRTSNHGSRIRFPPARIPIKFNFMSTFSSTLTTVQKKLKICFNHYYPEEQQDHFTDNIFLSKPHPHHHLVRYRSVSSRPQNSTFFLQTTSAEQHGPSWRHV